MAEKRVAVVARHVVTPSVEPKKLVPNSVDSSDDARQLAQQLSLEELLGLIGGVDFWHTRGVPRLGIPPLRLTDGPSGARGPFLHGPRSACVPCGVALGATWNPKLCYEVAALLGAEAREKGANILLAPTVNLQRFPLSGRHFECFSEDPFLTSRLAVAYIQGVQSVPGVGACVKHLVANDQEQDRMWSSSEVTEETLRKVHLKPFEAAVKEAKVVAVMTAYNRLNGVHCSQHEWLLKTLLRKEWNFQGLVMSDWYGSHSTVSCLRAGLDLEMPFRPEMCYGQRLLDAVRRGHVAEEEVQDRAVVVLRTMGHLGLLGRGNLGLPVPMRQSLDNEVDRRLLKDAAQESIVLLKNSGNLLPLPVTHDLLVIGPNAVKMTLQGGGSAQVVFNAANRDLVAALRDRVKGTVSWELGYDSATYLPPLRRDLCSSPDGRSLLEMEVHGECRGEAWPDSAPLGKVPVMSMESLAVFKGLMMMRSPLPDRPQGPWSACLRTRLRAKEAGRYEISLATSGRARLRAKGQWLLQHPPLGAGGSLPGELDLLSPLEEHRTELSLGEGEAVELEVQWVPDVRGLIFLGCRRRDWADQEELCQRAVAAAKHADTVIVVVGTDDVQESEGRDQDSMSLPHLPSDLISKVTAANPRTVVVLNTGSPKELGLWHKDVAALLAVWFGGQEGAEALASVLLEGCSEWGPCGRLPTTWPRTLADTVAGEIRGPRYPGESGRVLYSEGQLIGHRWFEAHRLPPLFHFGFGLSFTDFLYKDAVVFPSTLVPVGTGVLVLVEIKNVGRRPGKEVVQAYALRSGSPAKELVAFDKVALQPLEVGTAVLSIRGDVLGSVKDERLQILVGPDCATTAWEGTIQII